MAADRDMKTYDTAAIWADRLMAGRPLDAADQQALETWLAADARHAEALNACLEVEGMLDAAHGSDWADGLIAAAEAELAASGATAPATWWRNRPAWTAPALVGMAALLALAIALPVWTGQMRAPAPAGPDETVVAGQGETFVTARGERRAVSLSDGSVVTLNTGSQISIGFSGSERRVVLAAGEALFEVAHDPARPFVVEAGGHEVRAVGTEFNVYARADGRTVVTVVDGLVETRLEDGPASAALLRRGDQVELRPGEPAPEPRRVDVVAATAWQRGMLIFDDRALGEVVSEFRRYSDIEIAFADPALSELRVSGSFDLTDSDAFLAALAATESVRLDRTRDRVIVRPAADERG